MNKEDVMINRIKTLAKDINRSMVIPVDGLKFSVSSDGKFFLLDTDIYGSRAEAIFLAAIDRGEE
jgi:hypothetical protein